jgi:hypothetical protein
VTVFRGRKHLRDDRLIDDGILEGLAQLGARVTDGGDRRKRYAHQ